MVVVLQGIIISLVCGQEAGTAKDIPVKQDVEEGEGEGMDVLENMTSPKPIREWPKTSLFESNCTYNKSDSVNEDDCNVIQLLPDRQVEVLLPVVPVGANYSILVPFLVKPAINSTSLSIQGQKNLGVDQDNQNLTILDRELIVKRGEENILGLDFLQHCLLAIDYFSRDAGLAIYDESGAQYAMNWPLESFKDPMLEAVASHKSRKHKLLKKTYKKLAEQYTNEVSELKRGINKQDQLIHSLKAKLSAFDDTFQSQTEAKPKYKTKSKGKGKGKGKGKTKKKPKMHIDL